MKKNSEVRIQKSAIFESGIGTRDCLVDHQIVSQEAGGRRQEAEANKINGLNMVLAIKNGLIALAVAIDLVGVQKRRLFIRHSHRIHNFILATDAFILFR